MAIDIDSWHSPPFALGESPLVSYVGGYGSQVIGLTKRWRLRSSNQKMKVITIDLELLRSSSPQESISGPPTHAEGPDLRTQ